MIQTAHFRAAMQALAAAGVSELVVSPGSRSTPIVAAAVASGIRCRSIIDERSAAHFALGRARATGRPQAVVCTSGSAAACYAPAVVEARAARLPLIVITADRPPELQGCEAPQTIDQVRLYGEHARYFDLGAPAATSAAARVMTQAVHAALSPVPGPVQINAPARKPLEPADLPADAPAPRITAVHPPAPAPATDAAIAALAAAASGARGVITVGPAPLRAAGWRDAVAALSAATGFPILAEATSQLRLRRDAPPMLGAFDLIYEAGADAPDLVIQVGAPPVSAAWSALLSRARPRRIVVTDHGWPDPHNDAEAIVVGEIASTLARAAARISSKAPTDFADRLAAADDRAWRAVEAALSENHSLGEGQAVRAAVAAVPAGALLALANSLPVRSIDTYCPPVAAEAGVLHQRGASGIDGAISAAAGAASCGDRPVVLLVGDVGFSHDATGLLAARHARAPLVVVVIDNGGGRIFERLPVAAAPALAAHFESLWLTPPQIDIAGLARSMGTAAVEVDTAAALSVAVAEAAARPGCTVIRARVAPGSAEATRQQLVATLRGGR